VASGARVEPALGQAAPGSRWQFLRQGYFFADPLDSRPGAPVFNRTIGLKDTWAARAAAGPEVRAPRARKPAAGMPRPKPAAARKPGRAELRAGARAADPVLAAAHARYLQAGLAEAEADLLSGDTALSAWFDAAVAAGAAPPSAARWLVNELLGLARDRSLADLPLSAAGFGRFVRLLDAGRVAPAAGKTLLASLAERGGDPEQRLSELGLARVEDRAALEAALDRALASRPAEVARYRAGEKKLLGVLLGAAMRETGGAADAAAVRKLLQERLG
jgi:hypothetical protein